MEIICPVCVGKDDDCEKCLGGGRVELVPLDDGTVVATATQETKRAIIDHAIQLLIMPEAQQPTGGTDGNN